jgi:hypothetical protein
MGNESARKSRMEQATEDPQDTVNLTAEELRSIAGGHGVYLNIVVEKDKSSNGHHMPHHHHGGHKHPG